MNSQNRSKQSPAKKTKEVLVITEGLMIIPVLITNVVLQSQRLLLMACFFKVLSIH